ncbi:MAG: alginate lyase family protein [Acidobacteriota bacterium]
MHVKVAQLKKLKGKSFREIRLRGKQEIAKLNERLLGIGTNEMSDAALLREIHSPNHHGTGEGISALILERIRTSITPDLYERETPVFLPSFAYRDDIPSLVLHRFPNQWLFILDRAGRAINGRFDLLGFTDLSFGDPIDWHLEPISGKRTPLTHWSTIDYLNPEIAGDKKITWELNRHAHFVTLGQAYWLTNDERYAQAFVAQASHWMDANPPNLGINWASSLELAFRSISWLWALHLFAESHHLTARFVARLLKFLVAHGRHIESYLSHYFSPNTHLTGEALGLLYIGAALPELSRAKPWRQIGLKILLEQLPAHIRTDGVYFEQSTYYHRYTVDFFIHLLTLSRSCYWPLPDEVEEKLALALDHLMWLTRPDGTTPLVGDDDGGRLLKLGDRAADDFRDTLATGATLLNRGDWKYVAGDAAIETLWLLGPEGLEHFDEIEIERPTETARGFSEGGYYVMRDGWWKDSTYALIDCGPHGVYNCGHAHADALAFEFTAQGTNWLVDPGTYTYTGDIKTRDEFRETAAHNTATVDGLLQSQPAGIFSWNHIATAKLHSFNHHAGISFFSGSHDGYARLQDAVIHRRNILCLHQHNATALPTYLVVQDEFSAQDRHDYSLFFHFTPECAAISMDNQIRVIHRNHQQLAIFTFAEQPLRTEILRGYVSPVYGERDSAPIATIEFNGTGEQTVMNFILPFTTNHQGAQVAQKSIGVKDARAFIVTLGDSQDVVIAGNAINLVECKGLSAIAQMAWARFVGNRLVRTCFVKGKVIKVHNKFSLHSTDVVNHCVIQVASDHLEIAIEGTNRFTLETKGLWKKISLDGNWFDLNHQPHNLTFARDTGQWQLKVNEK